MNSKFKSYLFNVIFIISLLTLTTYYIFKEQNINDIVHYVLQANKFYVGIAVIMVFLFVCGESVIIHYLMHRFSYRIPLRTCIRYSFIGFFVSYITPSASGGQPAQMYYMSKDGIKVSESSLVLMVVTIAYKGVLLFLCAFAMLFEYSFILEYMAKSVVLILVFGIIANTVVVGLLLFVIFKQSFAKTILVTPIIWLGKKKIIRNYQKWTKKVLAGVMKYENGAKYLKENKHVFFNVLLMTMVQRFLIMLVTYYVYKAFGLSGFSMLEIVSLQIMITMCTDCLPLPGGMGASESIFVLCFNDIFVKNGIQFVLPGMVLSRGISFYLVIVVGGMITLVSQFTRNRKQERIVTKQ